MITSVQNPRVQKAKKLLKRACRSEEREFLVEGARSIREAFDAGAPLEGLFADLSRGPEIQRLAARAQSESVELHEVSPAVMKSMSATTTAPGIVGVCRFIDIDAAELMQRRLSLAIVLGRVRDPGNAGTIIRSSRAAGADAVFVAAETVDIYNPKLVRASAGALFWTPLARNVPLGWLLRELENQGINRVAADPRGDSVYDEVDMVRPTALLAGNEAWGLEPALADQVDVRAYIPMAGLSESLNVAVASAVLLFEAARQRRNIALG